MPDFDFTRPFRCRNGDAAAMVGTRPDGVAVVALRDRSGDWDHFQYNPDGTIANGSSPSLLDLVHIEPAPPPLTLQSFLNAAKAMRFVERHEIQMALGGSDLMTDEAWDRYRTDPLGFLCRTDDHVAAAIWKCIERSLR